MKKTISILAVSTLMAGMALAQGHGGHGKPAGAGKPATTGLEHAEATANPKGDKGIETAEAKQDAHKGKKGKSGKVKTHKHSKASTTTAPATK
jgi:hypothetical protein